MFDRDRLTSRNLATVALTCGVLLHVGPLHGAEPVRVLFIGNSYTYFNNAPEMFAGLARAALRGREVETRMVALPGRTLLSLWERSDARRALRSSRWDYVVLQDQSQLGDALRDGKFVVNAPTLLHWGARMFDAEVRQAGGRTVLLQTWSRRDEPHQQADLDFAYDSVARELGAILAPVGRVWARVRQEGPRLDLYGTDGSHPSAIGSYVLASTLVATLFPEGEQELPSSVSGHAVNGLGVVDAKEVPLVDLPVDEARRLRKVVWSVVNDMRRMGGYLNAAPPEPPRPASPGGQTVSEDQPAGLWSGALTFYPAPAVLDLTLRFDGHACQGEVAIQVPDRKHRYEAALAECSWTAGVLSFSVPTLPLPSLVDRFTGRTVDGRLVGTVERTGRDLGHAMSGTWSLARATPRPDN